MSIIDELLQMEEIFKKVKALNNVRSQLSYCYGTAVILNRMVLKYQSDLSFLDIPQETRSSFVRLYQIFNQGRLECEADPAFADIIHPPPEGEYIL